MIKVDDDYYISADTYCYTVMKKCGKDKNGNDTFRTLSYPCTLTGAIEYIIKYQQRQYVSDNDCDLPKALKAFKQIQERMHFILNEISEMEEVK